jgi:hypothetical protein
VRSRYVKWLGELEMENVELFDDGGIAFGLSVGEIQSVACRQLVGSFVVAVVIAAAAAFTALRPVSYDTAVVAPHNVAVIQQPSFVTPLGQRVAAIKQRELKLP